MNIHDISIDDIQFVCAKCTNEGPWSESWIVTYLESGWTLGCSNHKDSEIGIYFDNNNNKLCIMDTPNIVIEDNEGK